MRVIESLDDLRAVASTRDVKIVCVGAKPSLEDPAFARAVFGANDAAMTTFRKMTAATSADASKSTASSVAM